MLTNSLRRATSILVGDRDPTFRKGLRFSLNDQRVCGGYCLKCGRSARKRLGDGLSMSCYWISTCPV
jgi:hypothetical protein